MLYGVCIFFSMSLQNLCAFLCVPFSFFPSLIGFFYPFASLSVVFLSGGSVYYLVVRDLQSSAPPVLRCLVVKYVTVIFYVLKNQVICFNFIFLCLCSVYAVERCSVTLLVILFN
jgi:hypothetical protein